MELFTSNFSSTILNHSPWRPSLSSPSSISASFSKTPLLQWSNLRFLPPPFHLLHPLQISPTSCRFASPASSPSSVDLEPKIDKLPAELEISETQEPNSRVSFFFFPFLTLGLVCLESLRWTISIYAHSVNVLFRLD